MQKQWNVFLISGIFFVALDLVAISLTRINSYLDHVAHNVLALLLHIPVPSKGKQMPEMGVQTENGIRFKL